MAPLSLALLAFAVGAVALQWQPVLPSYVAWIGGAASAMVAALAVAVTTKGRRASAGRIAQLLAIAFAVAAAAGFGFGYAAWRAEVRLADALPTGWEGEDIVVVGVIDELPQSSARSTRFAFAVERVETTGAVVPSKLSLAWYAPSQPVGPGEPVPALAAGERWQLVVRLKRPHGTVNPKGFDVEAWLLENGFRATGYVRSAAANVRLDPFAGRLSDYVQRARAAVRDRIVAALPDARYAGVIVALTIGEQRAISEAQWQVFNRTGITHLISISGLHVTVFATLAAALAFALTRRCTRLTARIPARQLAALVGVVAAAAYVLLAGAQVPAVRTFLMLTVAALGVALARPGTASIVWLWALVVVLLWDPWAGFAPGFWLSFGAVGLLLYAHAGRLRAAPAPSRLAAVATAFHAAARAQALVTVGLVPGTLALFQQASVISPLANALAIPAVTFVVVPFALLGIVAPFDLPFQAAHLAFCALMVPLEAMAGAPAAIWQQHAPPAWTVWVAVAGVALIAAPRGIPGRGLGVALLLPLFVVRPLPPGEGAFRMTVLDVGQGLAVVVQTHAHALLYDTGPRFTEEADAGGRIVVPYLRAAGIRALDAMIVTHQDADHSGGALSVMRAMPVALLSSSLPPDHEIVGARGRDSGATTRCEAGQQWDWDGVRFAVLSPTALHYAVPRLKPNDLSCVLRIGSAYGSALLTGDLEARGELELVRHDAGALRSDVLVVPHHGSRTSSTPAFIAATAPSVAVFTPGYRNRFGHPRPEVVERYDAAGVAGFRTDYDGALTFDFASDVLKVPRAERRFDRRYWRGPPARESGPLD